MGLGEGDALRPREDRHRAGRDPRRPDPGARVGEQPVLLDGGLQDPAQGAVVAVHRRRRDAAGELGAEPLLDLLGVEPREPLVAEARAGRTGRGPGGTSASVVGASDSDDGEERLGPLLAARSPTCAGRSSRHGPCRPRPRGRSGRRRPCGGTSGSDCGPTGRDSGPGTCRCASRSTPSRPPWDTSWARTGYETADFPGQQRSRTVTVGQTKTAAEQVVYPLNGWRRRRESNPGTGLCRPLPQPLGHVARWRPGPPLVLAR